MLLESQNFAKTDKPVHFSGRLLVENASKIFSYFLDEFAFFGK